MSLRWHYVIQFLAFVLQGINVTNHLPWIPAEWAPTVTMLLSAVQGAMVRTASNHNPDGTPAEVAYIPKEKP